MGANSLISICIPAYKNVAFLKRLLDSIAIQDFRDFEVIVSDDSPHEEVGRLCGQYEDRFPLRYFRNEQPLGTPENWNAAIRKATGSWIKLMHDDDWFADKESLSEFARAVAEHPETGFIFSAYRDIFLDENRSREMFVNPSRYKAFLRNNTVLFARNIVGPPSVVLYRNDGRTFFDKTVKWVVDIEFYIRFLTGQQPVYIRKVLINVGLGKEQVTQDCFRQRPIEIPENFYLLNKVGAGNLRNVRVYDAWWRLMRNLEIQSEQDIRESGYSGKIPTVILSMVRWQKALPRGVWKNGVFSKTGMMLNYIFNLFKMPS
jgi:glycosyltransferase involved in cell wall biosynthesis